MFIRIERYFPTVVALAVALHLLWAAGIILEPSSVFATAPSSVLVLMGIVTGSQQWAPAILFAAVAMLAGWGLISTSPWRHLWMVPQHLVLSISAIGAMHAMWLGEFADGVTRTHWFLIVDQSPIVLITLAHLTALIFISKESHGRHT